MDKVIDGVDVSGCKHYKIGTCVADYLLTDMNFSEAKCKLCPNCYYKQLQRAKAEIKELKKELEKHKSKIGHLLSPLTDSDFQDKLKKLEQENERLKETEKEISDFISDISTCGFRYDDRCPDNLDELQQCIEDLCNKFDNYKQALQEIREYCRNLPYDFPAQEIAFIINKINSVIGAEE